MRVSERTSPAQALALTVVIGLGIFGAAGCGPKDDTATPVSSPAPSGGSAPSAPHGGPSLSAPPGPSAAPGAAGTGGGTTGQ